jgi:formate hydrogenlyase subunit 6/NADH:ubiquinone oxidoreductase subunit I
VKTISRSYWRPVFSAIRTLSQGLAITFRHLLKARKSTTHFSIAQPGYFQSQHGIGTVQYPHIKLPVPDTGRYQLHNEIDDCIVCDKCAKICPVDCITIEPIRSAEEFGKTSDGSPKRIYAAKFDIDMGKCCFCGLCTTVCPTECLTMTKEYDFSTFDILTHNFVFAEMSPSEIDEKKKAFETYQQQKVQAGSSKPQPKPSFKPRIKPAPDADPTL